MGIDNNVSADTFPKQGRFLGREVDVCFHYDTSRVVRGVIVRDDRSEPFLTIIRMSDGRHILGTECQYKIRAGVN